MSKIIRFEDAIGDKKVTEEKSYTIDEILTFPEVIENKLNEIYDFGTKYKDCGGICTDEQMKLFSKIFCSYFTILFSEIDEYTGSSEENKVLYRFAKDLDEICSSLPDLQQMIKEEDKKVIRLENNSKNNV